MMTRNASPRRWVAPPSKTGRWNCWRPNDCASCARSAIWILTTIWASWSTKPTSRSEFYLIRVYAAIVARMDELQDDVYEQQARIDAAVAAFRQARRPS